MNHPKLAYISFDVVPAPKGAAIHIAAFVQALAAEFGETQLITVSPTADTTHSQEIWPQVFQTQLPALGDTLINRVLYFRRLLVSWWQQRWFEVIHIRSIYEGFPIALNKKCLCNQLIFEVNGLPSIELKYRYPAVAEDQELLHKLVAQEQICLDAADLIVTPSWVTSNYLQTRGVCAEKIRVIPNGVDLEVFTDHPPQEIVEKSFRLLYFGTLSAWQGVNLAVETLALITRDFSAELIIVGQAREFQVQALKQLAMKLGVTQYLTILEAMSQTELVKQIHSADVIVAPLTPNDRNLIQGCCPLKILEGMATGTPVIASDLPVVRELAEDGTHLLLVKPGSAKAIKDAVVRLKIDTELRTQLGVAARQLIENRYTWKQAGDALIAAYQQLGINREMSV